jgi:hypothetical protein
LNRIICVLIFLISLYTENISAQEKEAPYPMCSINMEYGAYKKVVESVVEMYFEGKRPVLNPSLFLKYGPPASGKSTIMNLLLKVENLKLNSIVDIMIDDIVVALPCYAERLEMIEWYQKRLNSKELIDELFTNNSPLKETLLPYLEAQAPDDQKNKLEEYTRKRLEGMDPSKIAFQLKQALYFAYRTTLYGDEISTHILDDAIAKKYNIAWETTGRKPDYIIQELQKARRAGYRTVCIYPFVLEQQLVDRIEKREEETGQLSAPVEWVREITKVAQNNIKYIIKYVDKLYIYDNTGGPGEEKLIFTLENQYEGQKGYPHSGREGNMYFKGPGRQVIIECDCERLTTTIDNMEEELRNLINKYGDELCPIPTK